MLLFNYVLINLLTDKVNNDAYSV